jgi:hypothetical protein
VTGLVGPVNVMAKEVIFQRSRPAAQVLSPSPALVRSDVQPCPRERSFLKIVPRHEGILWGMSL